MGSVGKSDGISDGEEVDGREGVLEVVAVVNGHFVFAFVFLYSRDQGLQICVSDIDFCLIYSRYINLCAL